MDTALNSQRLEELAGWLQDSFRRFEEFRARHDASQRSHQEELKDGTSPAVEGLKALVQLLNGDFEPTELSPRMVTILSGVEGSWDRAGLLAEEHLESLYIQAILGSYPLLRSISLQGWKPWAICETWIRSNAAKWANHLTVRSLGCPWIMVICQARIAVLIRT